ncbi:Uncharacterized protein YpmS [Evansella caseinilytica]|uniref:Uncharacterized protein YpmS n=1 Tax=Evansella caseinilytica TaxID=1503961 RepID=A0A1H3K2Y5_9BACI|nr:YpmS family protein [Evansella caseinilytica]SDY45884.1 Uncharacterized protein YpmS [Evansella caseinilytica]
MSTKLSNPWKTAFIILSILIAAMLFSAFIALNQIFSNGTFQEPPSSFPVMEGAEFTVTTTKDDVNYWLEKELGKEQAGTELGYRLFLDDYIYFQTSLHVLGFEVPLEMVLEPAVTAEGNIELIERSFSVGSFELSSGQVFQLISIIPGLPDWIYILPDERKFYIDLQNGISEEVQLKVTEFDLQVNNIQLLLTLK